MEDSQNSEDGGPVKIPVTDGALEDESLVVQGEVQAEPVLSPEEQIIEQLKTEARENYDKYLRAVAELENYKKRAIKERSELIRYAGENLARDLLEVLDTLYLAVANQSSGSSEDFAKGVELVLSKFVAILEQHSIRGEESQGKLFDPLKHEALASKPTTEVAPGTIVDEYKRAYFYRDKLLRPAQVVVASEPKTEQPPEEKAQGES